MTKPERPGIDAPEEASIDMKNDLAEHLEGLRNTERGLHEAQVKSSRARALIEERRAREVLGQQSQEVPLQTLQELVLSQDAEAVVAAAFGERGLHSPYMFTGGDGDHAVVVIGTEHVCAASPTVDAIEQILSSQSFDLVLREGTSVLPEGPHLTDAEVLQQHGEQTYVERLAEKQGIPVERWDAPWGEMVSAVLQQGHQSDVVAAWMVSYVVKHLHAQGTPPAVDAVRSAMGLALTPETTRVIEEATGQRLDPVEMDLDRIANKYLGSSIAAIDADTAERLGSPWFRGPTNDVIRSMNNIRDARAIAVLARAKEEHRRVLVVGGGDHVLAWRHALEVMYPENNLSAFDAESNERREIPSGWEWNIDERGG